MTRSLKTILSKALLFLCLIGVTIAVLPDITKATHFRSGTISWTPTENPGEVEFRMKTVWRNTFSNWGLQPIGATINHGNFAFGDGSGTNITHTIVNRNAAEGWVEFEAVFRRNYVGDGPYLAVYQICCRISNSQNANDTVTRMEVLVAPNSGNSSPVSNQFPLVLVPQSSESTFFVSAADPNNDNLRFRLATLQESRFRSQISGLSIDQNSGLVTWDNSTLDLTTLYSIQVIVEDLDENGDVKSKIPVEFVLQIIELPEDEVAPPAPPVCEITPESPFSTSIDNQITFNVSATTPDEDVTVTLAGIGFPSGSSMNPGLPVADQGTVSSEFSWTPTASQTGSFVLTFSATDQFSQQTQCNATINVTSNQPPVADAGPDQTVDCTNCEVTLDGSGSTDPDGDELTYEWVWDGGTATGVSPVVKLPIGEHTITLTVDDGNGETDTDEVTITVVDTTPPELITESDPYILWPASHKYHTFDIADFIISVTDACDENVGLDGVVITRVTSDEPENQSGSNNARGRNGGGGDGNTVNDIVIAEDGKYVDLRAERLGGGNGRVYTVYLGVVDANGNEAEAKFYVHVPQNPNRPAINDGVAYTVNGLTPEAQSTSQNMMAAGISGDVLIIGNSASNEQILPDLASDLLPDTFELNQNYPNPFNPSTLITYQVATAEHVSIEIFDIAGRRVSTLVNETKPQGTHEVQFNANSLNSGVYFYRIRAGNFVEMKQMTLIK